MMLRAGTFGTCLPWRLLSCTGLGQMLCCRAAELGETKCFPLPAGSARTCPNKRLFSSVLPSPGGSTLLSLPLQWGRLAAPNLHLQCAHPRGTRVGDCGRYSVYDSGVRATFSLLSPWWHCSQIGYPPAPFSGPRLVERVCGSWPAWAHSTVFLWKGLDKDQTTTGDVGVLNRWRRLQGTLYLLQI